MKAFLKPHILPLFTLGAGGLGFSMQLWLLGTGVDEKGLLDPTHPANALSFVLAAAMMAFLFLYTAKLPKIPYKKAFPASLSAGTGNFIAAAGVLYTVLSELLTVRDVMSVVCFLVGLLAVACLVYLGFCRIRQVHPSMVFHSVITVYLIVHLICQYRSWSPEPQLQAYCFQLFASVLLMLTAYHRTALVERQGSTRWFLLCNQAALFFCCLSLPGESRLFYLTMGIWMALDTMTIPQPQPEEITDAAAQ